MYVVVVVVIIVVNYSMPTKPIKKTVFYRNISNISITKFLSDLHVLILNDQNDSTMLNLNNCLSHLLSIHSPQKLNILSILIITIGLIPKT